MDAAVGEAALGPLLVVDRREQVRRREHVAQREEHALGAAHVDEEVVHEGDPCSLLHRRASLYRPRHRCGSVWTRAPSRRARRRPLHARAAGRARRRLRRRRVARLRPRPRARRAVPPRVTLVRHRLGGRVLFGAAAVARRPRWPACSAAPTSSGCPRPPPSRPGAPFVLTVHDRSWERRPPTSAPTSARGTPSRGRARSPAAPPRYGRLPRGAAELARAWGVRADGRLPRASTARAGDRRAAGRYLLFVGALEPRKALGVLAAAHASAQARGLDAELVVVGDGAAGASTTPSSPRSTPARWPSWRPPGSRASACRRSRPPPSARPPSSATCPCSPRRWATARCASPAATPARSPTRCCASRGDDALRARLGAAARERAARYTWERAAAALHPCSPRRRA